MSLEVEIALGLGTLDLDVSFEVRPGEVLALLGPNGAGKSTVLRTLAGLLAADRGGVKVDGVALDDAGAGVFVPPERRPIGFVFQDYLLFPHLSALENVAFGLRARGMAKSDARDRAAEWLGRMGLADQALHRPRSLSGGQAQRVALARALATEPRVLLLDEPLAALDAGTRREVRRDLRHHLASFPGMRVLVTHDPVDVYALADRVAVLDAGRIVQTGTIAEVTAHPRSRHVAEMVGTNLVTGTVTVPTHGPQSGPETGPVLTTPTGARVVVADAPVGEVFAVIRPQAVALSLAAAHDVSARNVWPMVVTDLDRMGDRVRVALDGPVPLTAEITAAAMDALSLSPGDAVYAAVKATEIEVYPA